MFDELGYYEALRLAQQTKFNVNHGGWIIHQDDVVKYTLDTLDGGKTFRIGIWEPDKTAKNGWKNVGRIVREIEAPAEIQFLLGLQ